jgi:hypothetical protein
MLGTVVARATSVSLVSAQRPCNEYATVQINTATKISEKTKLVTTNRWLQTGPKRVTFAPTRGCSLTIEVSVFSAGWFSATLFSDKVPVHLSADQTGY